MIFACPTCGASVEFRYDDSLVRVCDACRSTVLRSDRGIESLGRVADVTPIDSPLRLFADGKYNGAGFLLVGMSQIDHGAGGMWQEWYAKLDGGQWGWLTEAQGRFYMTFERPYPQLPRLHELRPGVSVPIGDRFYTVGEVTKASYRAAAGEIPYRYEPGAEFWYADLSDGMGGFATIDYNDGSEPPALYVGTQVNVGDLRISGGERPFAGEAPRRQADSLKCPNCGGKLELAAPDRAMRVGCPYCAHLISVEHGNLQILARLARRPPPEIPLGTKATFSEGEMTVIGYVQRSAYLGGLWYAFDEYLLFRPELGFRWLVNSDGHWSYVQPIAPGAVELGGEYDGVKFKLFQVAELRVDHVVGEFYWAVEVGERVVGEDYIAPPAMLSCESSRTEQQWSLSTYLTRRELLQAVPALKGRVGPAKGIGANQPYALHGVALVGTIIAVLMAGAGMARCGTAKNKVVATETFTLEPGAAPPLPKAADEPTTTSGAAPEPAGHIKFSRPFTLESGKNIEIELSADLYNNWGYVAVDLVNDKTGAVVSYDANLEYYSGVEDGDSWSEGSKGDSQVLGPMETGQYLVRIESQVGGNAAVQMRMTVHQDVFRLRWWLIAAGIVAFPFLLMWWHHAVHHKRKWEDAQLGYLPPSEGDL
ncbi:MAG: DUF4178 domain-containing protein [Deltaproteobacteria bacterium]|nr:DUF4178 domain-containing protein [Deltaproteobacteria bacterium]